MLVLSRLVGQQIKIGDDIVITLVGVDRGKVRIGIDAPRNVSIMRTELLPIREESLPCQPQPPNSETPTSPQ